MGATCNSCSSNSKTEGKVQEESKGIQLITFIFKINFKRLFKKLVRFPLCGG